MKKIILLILLGSFAFPINAKEVKKIFRGSDDGIHYDYIKYTNSSCCDVYRCIDAGETDCAWDWNSPAIILDNGSIDGGDLHNFIIAQLDNGNMSGVANFGGFWVKWKFVVNTNDEYDGQYIIADTYAEMVDSQWEN